jgi:hypothetical protein
MRRDGPGRLGPISLKKKVSRKPIPGTGTLTPLVNVIRPEFFDFSKARFDKRMPTGSERQL